MCLYTLYTHLYKVEPSTITFPKIGTITCTSDGAYEVGPLEHLGGLFGTAAEYFEAWTLNSKFGLDADEYYEMYAKPHAKEIRASVHEFSKRMTKMAKALPAYNEGPFPLVHGDLNSFKVLVDDDYHIVALIDFETTHTCPWEAIPFPSNIDRHPAPLGPAEWYDSKDNPADESLKQLWRNQELYVDEVRRLEKAKGLAPMLSEHLGNWRRSDLAVAMQLFREGSMGFYDQILDNYIAYLLSIG